MERNVAGRKLERRNYAKSLKKNADIERILEYYKVRNLQRSGRYINGSCPLDSHGGPDHQPSFGMVDEKGTKWNGFYKCWKCGKGSIVDFIMLMEGCDFSHALGILKEFSVGGSIYSQGVLDREMAQLLEGPKIEGDDDEESHYIPPMIEDPEFIAKYMIKNKKRKFERQGLARIIQDFQIGLGYYRGELQIIIPILNEHGEWMTFFAQNPIDNSEKWFPKGSKIGKYLFGLNIFAGSCREVVVAEGIWDALKIVQFGHPCVATFSTSMTEDQADLLAEHFDSVCIAYDADDGGDEGWKRATELLYPETDLHRIRLPKGKDPCDCNREQFSAKYDRKIPYSTESCRSS